MSTVMKIGTPPPALLYEKTLKAMQRVAYIDQISGLLIVYMIVGHAFAFCDMREIMQTHLMQILGFFMFWFFYKSGMFYREKSCSEITKRGG